MHSRLIIFCSFFTTLLFGMKEKTEYSKLDDLAKVASSVDHRRHGDEYNRRVLSLLDKIGNTSHMLESFWKKEIPTYSSREHLTEALLRRSISSFERREEGLINAMSKEIYGGNQRFRN